MSHLSKQGHQTGNFEKKALKNNKHFERLLGKIYMFLTPSKTDGRVPRQKADLLGSFTADVCSDITGQFR